MSTGAVRKTQKWAWNVANFPHQYTVSSLKQALAIMEKITPSVRQAAAVAGIQAELASQEAGDQS